MNRFLALIATVFLLLQVEGGAHEVRPAYLQLHEETPGEFAVLWKTPMRGDMRLSLAPAFSGVNEKLTPIDARSTGTAAIETWKLRAPELRGQEVRILGLEGTMTDALVRIEFADGSEWTERLTASAPAAYVPRSPSFWKVGEVFTKLGIEHILTGIDHLLFILALLLITRGGWALVKTVTAFTVSHSITLTLATLGLVHIPQRPVEATIALSIIFVAAEIVHQRAGRVGITARAPWIVAFGFGLMHGLGFAGGLSDAGLPQGHIPSALLFFSIGVEIGHFLFIGAVLLLISLMLRARISFPRWAELVPPYAIGSVAMFWFIQRVLAF